MAVRQTLMDIFAKVSTGEIEAKGRADICNNSF